MSMAQFVIIDLPLSYANALEPKLFADRINNLSNTLTLKCGYDIRAASILINKLVDKQAQMDYAKNLGYALKQPLMKRLKMDVIYSLLYLMYQKCVELRLS